MKTKPDLTHALKKRSVDRMCDGGTWGTKDHKLLIDTLDKLSDRIRELEEGRIEGVQGEPGQT